MSSQKNKKIKKILSNLFLSLKTKGLIGNCLEQLSVVQNKKHKKICLATKNYFLFCILKNRKYDVFI